jgi:hypothetical protein
MGGSREGYLHPMAGGQPIAERVRRFRRCLERTRALPLLDRTHFGELLRLERRRSRPFSVLVGSIGEIDGLPAEREAPTSHST